MGSAADRQDARQPSGPAGGRVAGRGVVYALRLRDPRGEDEVPGRGRPVGKPPSARQGAKGGADGQSLPIAAEHPHTLWPACPPLARDLSLPCGSSFLAGGRTCSSRGAPFPGRHGSPGPATTVSLLGRAAPSLRGHCASRGRRRRGRTRGSRCPRGTSLGASATLGEGGGSPPQSRWPPSADRPRCAPGHRRTRLSARRW